MMPFLFPFRWGSGGESVATVVAVPFWTKVSVSAGQWLATPAMIEPRFTRIFPEEQTGPGFERITDVIG